MEKDFREGLSTKLGNQVRNQILSFFKKAPKEQLEHLQNELSIILEAQNPLRLLFEKIIDEVIEELNQSPDEKEQWNRLQENLWSRFDYHFQLTFQHYFRYSLLFCLLSDSHSNVFDKKYLHQMKKEFGLGTSGQLQKALMKTLDRCFFDEVKRGGKKSTLSDGKKLHLLALYNRYSVVIKNARREYKAIKKAEKTKRETQIKQDVVRKYEIPESHVESLFSVDTVADTALSWAKQSLKLNLNDEYVKDLLTAARQKWRGRGLIIDYRGNPGRFIYAVNPKDEIKKSKLRFTSVVKSLNNLTNNEFFVEMGF